MALTKAGRIGAVLITVGVVVGVLYYVFTNVLKREGHSSVLLASDTKLPEYKPDNTGRMMPAQQPAPGTEPAKLTTPLVQMEGMGWNAQSGLLLGLGGGQTMEGSIAHRLGLNAAFRRQDDMAKIADDLKATATAVKNGTVSDANVKFAFFMGDGAPAFLTGLNQTLSQLGPEYKVKVVGKIGQSVGEDKFMGPAEWLRDPQKARGGVVAGYLYDGDWNIAVLWAANNQIPVNPDETTYDPDALNFAAAKDYLEAVDKFNSNQPIELAVVKKGIRTGRNEQHGIDGVVTWFPGDERAVTGRGGVVSILSTKDNLSQMPCTMVGIDKYMKEHPEEVKMVLKTASLAADQIRNYPAAQDQAAEIVAKVFNEKTADYWKKGYAGYPAVDKQQNVVTVGGSRSDNLADNFYFYGLQPGTSNLYADVYRTFGDILVRLAPKLYPTYEPFDEIWDPSYLQALQKEVGTSAGVAELPKFTAGEAIREKVGSRSWNVTFQTGSAEFAPEAQTTLRELASNLAVSTGLKVEIHGYTDDVGDANANQLLSQRRAQAVQQYLQSYNASVFSPDHVQTVAHGEMDPVAPNDTEAGRAKNRRVVIVSGR